MNKGFRYAILTTIVLLLASCSSTKYVPDGSYLLDEVRIHTDNKEVKPSNLSMYIRQNPNAKWFSLIKTQLYVYNWSGRDVYTLDKPYIEEIRGCPGPYTVRRKPTGPGKKSLRLCRIWAIWAPWWNRYAKSRRKR